MAKKNKLWSLSMTLLEEIEYYFRPDHAFPDNNEGNNIGQQLKEPLKRPHFRLFGNLF
jgi:hypothetical protein